MNTDEITPKVNIDSHGIARGIEFIHEDQLRELSWTSGSCEAIDADSGQIVFLRFIGGDWQLTPTLQ